MEKIIVEFNNKKKSPIRKIILKRITEKIIQELPLFKFERNINILITFANVSEWEIRRLNKAYRKIDAATDVLSFPEFESSNKFKSFQDKNIFLGEIVLCYNNIAKYAKRYRLDIEEQLCEVVAHGVLHLLGYRHGKKMFIIQKKIKRYAKTR